MKLYDVLWKRLEKNGKAHWEQCGVLLDNNGRFSIKLDLIPVGSWDGWLVVLERDKAKVTKEDVPF